MSSKRIQQSSFDFFFLQKKKTIESISLFVLLIIIFLKKKNYPGANASNNEMCPFEEPHQTCPANGTVN